MYSRPGGRGGIFGLAEGVGAKNRRAQAGQRTSPQKFHKPIRSPFVPCGKMPQPFLAKRGASGARFLLTKPWGVVRLRDDGVGHAESEGCAGAG